MTHTNRASNLPTDGHPNIESNKEFLLFKCLKTHENWIFKCITTRTKNYLMKDTKKLTETNFWNEFSVFIEELMIGSNDHFLIILFKPIFWLKVTWWHSLPISGALSTAILWPVPTICWPLSPSFYCLRSMFIFNPACCPIIYISWDTLTWSLIGWWASPSRYYTTFMQDTISFPFQNLTWSDLSFIGIVKAHVRNM